MGSGLWTTGENVTLQRRQLKRSIGRPYVHTLVQHCFEFAISHDAEAFAHDWLIVWLMVVHQNPAFVDHCVDLDDGLSILTEERRSLMKPAAQ